MTLNEFLIWVGNSGGGAMVASWVLEQLKWYQELEADKKRLVFFSSTLVVTLLGFLGITYIPKDIIDSIAPYFAILYTTFGSIFLGTVFHKNTKA